VHTSLSSADPPPPLLPPRRRPLPTLHVSVLPEDDDDHNQGPMIWFALEPLVASKPAVAVELAVGSRIHGVRQNVARRISENIQTEPESVGGLVRHITSAPADVQLDVLRGLADALRGVRKTQAPSSWTEAAAAFAKSGSVEVRERARQLSVVFGDGLALDELKKVFADAKADGCGFATWDDI
jgi:hypothetical protein